MKLSSVALGSIPAWLAGIGLVAIAESIVTFAQSPAPVVNPSLGQELSPWFSLITSTGFAGLAWYLVVLQIPKLMKEHSEALASARKDYKDELKEERVDCDKRHKEILDLMVAQHKESMEAHAKHYDLTRENRHELANIGHSRMMDKALSERTRKVKGEGGNV